MKLVLIWKHCHAGEQNSYASYALLAGVLYSFGLSSSVRTLYLPWQVSGVALQSGTIQECLKHEGKPDSCFSPGLVGQWGCSANTVQPSLTQHGIQVQLA